MNSRPTCFVSRHVLGAHMYSMPTCIVGPHGPHVLWAHMYSRPMCCGPTNFVGLIRPQDMYCRPTCIVGAHVLWAHMYSLPTYIVTVHVCLLYMYCGHH